MKLIIKTILFLLLPVLSFTQNKGKVIKTTEWKKTMKIEFDIPTEEDVWLTSSQLKISYNNPYTGNKKCIYVETRINKKTGWAEKREVTKVFLKKSTVKAVQKLKRDEKFIVIQSTRVSPNDK